MKLNLYFGTCAAICGATVFLHIFGGGPEFPDIALTSGLDDKQSSMYVVLWHAVTLLLSVATTAYAAAAYSSHFRPAALFFSIQFLAIAALFLIVPDHAGRHLDPAAMDPVSGNGSHRPARLSPAAAPVDPCLRMSKGGSWAAFRFSYPGSCGASGCGSDA